MPFEIREAKDLDGSVPSHDGRLYAGSEVKSRVTQNTSKSAVMKASSRIS